MYINDSTLTIDETALPYGLKLLCWREASAFTPENTLAKAGEYYTHVYKLTHPATGWQSKTLTPHPSCLNTAGRKTNSTAT